MRGGNRVFVLGNAGVDLSIVVARLPRAGETLVGGGLARAPGGKGLNQAVTAARAGAAVHFLAPIGDDDDGRLVQSALDGEGFAGLHLVRLGKATDLSVILVEAGGENSIVTSGDCAEALEAGIAADFLDAASPRDILLLQGNLSRATTVAAMRRARERGVRVMLNTAPVRWDHMELVPLCDVLVANAGEAAAIVGAEDAARALHRAGAGIAIVTLGAAGCDRADSSGARRMPAAVTNVVDTTGAGDTFCGMLTAALAGGIPCDAAIALAQRAAALAVARRGAFAALPSISELATLPR